MRPTFSPFLYDLLSRTFLRRTFVKHKLLRRVLLSLMLFSVALQVSGSQAPATTDKLTKSSGSAWTQHGGNPAETRHSRLKNINTDNVQALGLVWSLDLPEPRGQEATPLVVDGVMYTTAAWNHVYALNPVSGEVLWHFDAEVPKAWGAKGCCDAVNRGVAYSCLLYTSPSPRDRTRSRMPSSA